MNEEKDEARARLVERIEAVRARFLNGLRDRTRELERLCAAAAGDDGQGAAAEARDALRRGLHNLAGSAATLGLTDLAREARLLEAQTLSAAGPRGAMRKDDAERLAARLAELREARS